jgi:hypothetical protein
VTDRHEPDREGARLDGADSGEPGFDDPGFGEPGFDDPGHAWVRDLLADTRVTTPVPQDVASRLDNTLAALQARRAAAAADEERPSVVVPLRRRLRPALVAAASVVAIVGGGLMIGQLAGTGSQNADTASSRAADRESSTDSGAAAESANPDAPGAVSGQAPKASAALPQLSTAAFAADAARVMQQVAGTTALSEGPDGDASPTPAPTDSLVDGSASKQLQAPPVTATPRSLRQELRDPSACPGPAIPGAVELPATLDGGQVALVFRAPTETGQLVEAWSCDGSTLLTSATVPR